MADLSNIMVDGVEYDIKDETSRGQIGDLSNLTTKDQTTLVNALNEVASIAGQAGADGVGVASVEQTTTSSADGGENIVTVTLDDGTKYTFIIKNGSKGSTGDIGPQGEQGIQGIQGLPGTDGAKGDTGVGIESITIEEV